MTSQTSDCGLRWARSETGTMRRITVLLDERVTRFRAFSTKSAVGPLPVINRS